MTIDERLDRIEQILASLVERERSRTGTPTDEVAQLLGKAAFTVREWAGWAASTPRSANRGRGAHPAWVVSHSELLRYRQGRAVAERIYRRSGRR